MKVYLYYQSINLGYFFEEKGNLFYTSNKEGEQFFLSNYINNYNLKESNAELIESLPNFLYDYQRALKNQDVIEMAKINENDSMFVKLYKLAKINFEKTNFHFELA